MILGLTQLFLMGPLLDARARALLPKPAVLTTLGASVLLLGGAGTIWLGLTWSASGRSGLPLTLSFCAITFAALAALWASPATLLHTAARPRRAPGAALTSFVVMNVLAGVAMAGLILAFARVLAIAVDPVHGGRPPLLALSMERRPSVAARRHPRASRRRALGRDAGPNRGARRLVSAVATRSVRG